jgi:hypothetical protein
MKTAKPKTLATDALRKTLVRERAKMLKQCKVNAKTLTLAYAVCKNEKLLNQLFKEAEVRAKRAKTKEMQREKLTLLRSLRPLLNSLVIAAEKIVGRERRECVS